MRINSIIISLIIVCLMPLSIDAKQVLSTKINIMAVVISKPQTQIKEVIVDGNKIINVSY